MTAPAFGGAMPYGDSAIPDGDDFEWEAPQPADRLDDFLGSDDDFQPNTELLDGETKFDPSIIEPKKRSKKALDYEKEVKGILRTGFHVLAANPKTVPDAAAMLQFGPALAEATGDLAAENAWAAKAVDFLTDTTENATLSFLAVAVPMTLQVLRNHEPTAEVTSGRRLKIGKREFRLRVRVKLPARIRSMTQEPKEYTALVFSDPDIQNALAKRGIKVHVSR